MQIVQNIKLYTGHSGRNNTVIQATAPKPTFVGLILLLVST